MNSRTILERWEDGRKQYVIECLARDEHPFDGWAEEFPDLAQQRLNEIEQEQELDAALARLLNLGLIETVTDSQCNRIEIASELQPSDDSKAL